jgi:hypothetical protein
MISEVERDSPDHADGQNSRQVVRGEHSVGDRMVAFVVNPDLDRVPSYLKTFAVFVNMNVCELRDDYCGCVGAYCTRENAHA